MSCYCGIDLHSTNSYVAILDEQDRPLVKRRVKNNMEEILGILAPLSEELKGIVVEYIYNWDWLVDGLMEAGYVVHLANTYPTIRSSFPFVRAR